MKITEEDLRLFQSPQVRYYVYLLLRSNEVVYVGITSHLGNRKSSHRGRQFDTMLIREYPSLALAKEAEQHYLAKYRPDNGTGQTKQLPPSCYKRDRDGLTARQRQVLSLIIRFHQESQRLPTLKDIGVALGQRSYHGVWHQITSLRQRGLLLADRIEATPAGLALRVQDRF